MLSAAKHLLLLMSEGVGEAALSTLTPDSVTNDRDLHPLSRFSGEGQTALVIIHLTRGEGRKNRPAHRQAASSSRSIVWVASA